MNNIEPSSAARRTSGGAWERTPVIAWSVGCIALLAIIASAKMAAEFVAPTVLASLFALTLAPVVRMTERYLWLPSSIAAAVVVGAVIAAGAIAAYTLAPSAEDWRYKAPSVIRALERQFRDIERELTNKVDEATAGRASTLSDGSSPTEAVIESSQKLLTDTMLAAPQIIVMAMYVGFLCYFLLAERELVLRVVMNLAVDWRMRLHLGRAMRDTRQNVSAYLLIFTVINIGLGSLAALAFWAIGLPNPTLWGAMVAVLNYMPYIGPMICNVVVFAVGLTTFSSFGHAMLPVAALVSLNILEGQLITPMVIGRQSRLGPLAVFVALAFGAWLWGPIGALVSTPLLIVIATICRHMVPPRVKRRLLVASPRRAA